VTCACYDIWGDQYLSPSGIEESKLDLGLLVLQRAATYVDHMRCMSGSLVEDEIYESRQLETQYLVLRTALVSLASCHVDLCLCVSLIFLSQGEKAAST
jgi:hypothetical protein